MKKTHGFTTRRENLAEAMAAVQHARLLDRTMMRYLFPDGRHVGESLFGLTKSLMAIRG